MTTGFTQEQREAVDTVLDILATACISAINHSAPRITDMDTRPRGVYDPGNPNDSPDNYRFPYVAQAMLEDLIERLQEQV